MKKFKSRNTSWQNVNKWYSKKVGEKGHYFQENVVFPNLKEIVGPLKESKILDLGCGEGVLSRELFGFKEYLGVDMSKGLIESAFEKNRSNDVNFTVGDISRRLELGLEYFTHAFVILALQNVENFYGVFDNAYRALKKGGKMFIVINHPHFRIPKSTAWGIDSKNRRQYRQVFRYMSEHKIRIDMNPGSRTSKEFTYSFHRSLNDLSLGLKDNGFHIESIYEWSSNKQSEGRFAEMENFARDEIPMFMCIVAIKN